MEYCGGGSVEAVYKGNFFFSPKAKKKKNK